MTDAGLEDSYRNHPLSADSILRRVRRDRGALDGITELDLAVDPVTEITDQNHVGGLEFSRQLADAARVGRDTRVLDACSGLGGLARVLAHTLGCRVLGVELLPFRCDDANELTRLVGLESLVEVECSDLLDFAGATFDSVLSQSSLVHFHDRRRLFSHCLALLEAGGTLAFEDLCLRAVPGDETQQRDLEELGGIWHASWALASDWVADLAHAGFEVARIDELDASGQAYFERLIAAAERATDFEFPETEIRGWQLGSQLFGKKLLGYQRIVARKSDASRRPVSRTP